MKIVNGRSRGQAGTDRQVGPATLALEAAYDALRRRMRVAERSEPGAGEQVAAQAAEALRPVLKAADSKFPTPQRKPRR